MLVILGLLWAGTLSAGEIKFGCADLFEVFQSYSGTKKADAYLKEKAEGFQEEINKMREDISALEKILESGLLSEDEKAQKSKEIEGKKKALEEKIKASNLVMMKERKEKVDNILKELEKKIAEFAHEKGYQMILDKKNVLYIDESMDITKKIIKYI